MGYALASWVDGILLRLFRSLLKAATDEPTAYIEGSFALSFAWSFEPNSFPFSAIRTFELVLLFGRRVSGTWSVTWEDIEGHFGVLAVGDGIPGIWGCRDSDSEGSRDRTGVPGSDFLLCLACCFLAWVMWKYDNIANIIAKTTIPQITPTAVKIFKMLLSRSLIWETYTHVQYQIKVIIF